MKADILVLGATGKQGGAVLRHLIANNNEVHPRSVRIMVRRPGSKAVKQLQQAYGSLLEVIQGDLVDENALFSALGGVSVVFAMQDFWGAGTGKRVSYELQQGHAFASSIARAAVSNAGVKHVVLSTAASCHEAAARGVEAYIAKSRIEKLTAQALEGTGVTLTILRPSFFMENFEETVLAKSVRWLGLLPLQVRPIVRLQMVSVEDIGKFVSEFTKNPAAFSGKVIELTGDDKSPEEVCAALTRQRGPMARVSLVWIPEWTVLPLFGVEAFHMFQWFNSYEGQDRGPFFTEILPSKAQATLGFTPTTFESYLSQEGKRQLYEAPRWNILGRVWRTGLLVAVRSALRGLERLT